MLVTALLLAAPSVAQKSSDRGEDAAAAAVAEATGGWVLSVRRKGEYYRVKVLTEGGGFGSIGWMPVAGAYSGDELVSRPISSLHISKARSAQALGGRAQD